jgi:RHS repeat-associated protein
MTSLTAKLTGGGGQTTEWVYGVTQSGGSGLDSNDVVGKTRWPDPSTGSASSGQQETVLVNALGQPLVTTDRNGNTHTLTYDILGRVIADAVTTLGSGVDSSVRRVETAYDTQGNAYLFTSYDATTSGSIVTQTQRAFNGLGQLTTEWQSRGAAVNTSTSPKVQYAYSTLDSSNRSRLTSVTYPSGYVLTHNYASGINGGVSRLSSLSDTSGTVESYDYLGLGTVVKRAHPLSGVDQTFVKQSGESNADAGDQYTGLDRFNRVADQRWRSSGGDQDRHQYAYDRNGNRVSKTNTLTSAYSEAYTYDGLNQLATFNRNSGARTQSWDYDALGNWDSVTTNGGSPQTRTHNKQNEITAVSGATTPTFDANGNMTTDETGKQYVYDAWNRLVVVKNSGGTTLKTYVYDALNRRVAETASGTTTDLYYSAQWQVLEEVVSGTTKARYVWSPVYVDAMILRDRDADGSSGNGLEERLWVMQDANWNVTGLVNGSGTVVERYAYDSFGSVTVMNGSWTGIGSGAYGWHYLYQGGRLDSSSGLYHFRNRDYSPTLGRWVGLDPIRFQSGRGNLYLSLFNSPHSRIDPTGLVDIPSWLQKIVGVEGAGRDGGTIKTVTDVHYDKQHKGGAHYDVHYIDENGNARKQRFWKDGTPFTEAENESMANTSRGKRGGPKNRRGGAIHSSALRSVAITSVVVAGATAIYDVYVEKGAEAAETKGTAVFGCRLIRAMLHSGELPEVYDEFGNVGERAFYFIIKGKKIRVYLEKLKDSDGYGILAMDAENNILVKPAECPLSGG